MSELTRCNHCTLKAIKARHGEDRVRLIDPNPDTFGWTEVLVDDRRVASFKVLTTHCVC